MRGDVTCLVSPHLNLALVRGLVQRARNRTGSVYTRRTGAECKQSASIVLSDGDVILLSDSKVQAPKAQTSIRSTETQRGVWSAAAERAGASLNGWACAALDRAAGVRALEVEVSDELQGRLLARARVSGVDVNSLVAVLLDQALVLYTFAAPASSATELSEQQEAVAKSVVEAGLAARVVAEPADADSVKTEDATPSSGGAAASSGASGGKASPARRSTCPGTAGRGVRCKLCGKMH